MFKTEIYRLLSKKTGLAAMLVAMLFILYFTLGNTVWGEGVIDDGMIYHGREAIAKDKEIAAEFAGPLTVEKVESIWEKYGPPVNYDNRTTTWEGMSAAAAMGGNDNYCNRFVAREFGQTAIGEDGRNTYVLADGWKESRYLQGNHVFGYEGSMFWYWDRFMMAYVLAHIVIIILLCPVFAEDYAFRTADIILATARGRFFVWKLRAAVGCLLASICYWLACGSVFLLYIAYYGWEGLQVSCGLAGVPMFFQKDAVPMWEGILVLYLCGWLSAVVLALLVCGISARCRQSFCALVRSLFLYFGPFAVMRVVLDSLPMGWINVLLHYICFSMPFSYPGTCPEAPDSAKPVLTALALAAALVGAVASARGYCRHQVER